LYFYAKDGYWLKKLINSHSCLKRGSQQRFSLLLGDVNEWEIRQKDKTGICCMMVWKLNRSLCVDVFCPTGRKSSAIYCVLFRQTKHFTHQWPQTMEILDSFDQCEPGISCARSRWLSSLYFRIIKLSSIRLAETCMQPRWIIFNHFNEVEICARAYGDVQFNIKQRSSIL
jgi:hypothetical protein